MFFLYNLMDSFRAKTEQKCRVCLSENNYMFYLYDKFEVNFDLDLMFSDVLMICSSVQVTFQAVVFVPIIITITKVCQNQIYDEMFNVVNIKYFKWSRNVTESLRKIFNTDDWVDHRLLLISPRGDSILI